MLEKYLRVLEIQLQLLQAIIASFFIRILVMVTYLSHAIIVRWKIEQIVRVTVDNIKTKSCTQM